MSDETPPLIELRRISKQFGSGGTRVDALQKVTLDVYPGERVGLVGPSGSGKGTLLNVIGCITEPSSGTLRLDGEPLYDGRWLRTDLRRLRLEKIGFIFQRHNLLPFLNAVDNVALVLDLIGATPAVARQRARSLLEYLDVGMRQDPMPASLSGGEAQRVAIARALANEPTAALDSQRAGTVMDLLNRVARERLAAIIVVTHDDKVFDRFDRIVRLRDGRLENDTPARAA
jgi:putative ABC transport system ATP-binding protein